MDPTQRDRVAVLRVCSGVYRKGKDIHSVRLNGVVRVSNALVFMAADRETVEEEYPGDIIGLHNHSRKEERSSGEECVRTCRYWWTQYHKKKNKRQQRRPQNNTIPTKYNKKNNYINNHK